MKRRSILKMICAPLVLPLVKLFERGTPQDGDTVVMASRIESLDHRGRSRLWTNASGDADWNNPDNWTS